MILPKSFFDSNSYFGISIGTSSIKAVSVDANGKVISFIKTPFATVDLNQAKPNLEPLINALKIIKAGVKFSSPYVAVVLAENQAFSKRFSLPAITMSEFSQAISWQMEDIFPFPPEEVYSDWKILRQSPQTMEALVVAVNRKKIDHLRACLAAVGLYPVSFETSASAISKISEFTKQEQSILIDVNSEENSVSFIESGVPLLTTTSISTNQNQNLIESLEISINTLFAYFREKRQSSTDLVDIYLTGDLADDNLSKTLESKLKRTVSLLTISQINPGFHQAYAAAVSHVEPPENEHSINLLPEDLRTWYQDHYHQSLLKKTLKIQIFAFLIGLFLTILNISYLNHQINLIETRSVPAPAIANSKAGFNPSEILKKANRINTLFPDKTGPQELLQAAIFLIPPEIKIENLVYEAAKQTFEIVGVAQTRNDLIKLEDNLTKSPLFDNVTLPFGSLTQQTDSSFTIKFSQKITQK